MYIPIKKILKKRRSCLNSCSIYHHKINKKGGDFLSLPDLISIAQTRKREICPHFLFCLLMEKTGSEEKSLHFLPVHTHQIDKKLVDFPLFPVLPYYYQIDTKWGRFSIKNENMDLALAHRTLVECGLLFENVRCRSGIHAISKNKGQLGGVKYEQLNFTF